MTGHKRDRSRSRSLDFKDRGSALNQSKAKTDLHEISIRETIGNIPGLWMDRIFGHTRTPDLEDVRNDVQEITKELEKIERVKEYHVDLDDISRDVDVIVSSLNKLDVQGSRRRGDRYSRELRSVKRDTRKMVRHFDSIRTRTSRDIKGLDMPDMHEVLKDVKAIESSISIGKAREYGAEKEKHEQYIPRKTADIKGPVHRTMQNTKEGSMTLLKRSVPFIFLGAAVLAYFLVSLKIMLDIPIRWLYPVRLSTLTIFEILLVILLVTIVVNYIRRLRIIFAKKNERPTWISKWGGDQ